MSPAQYERVRELFLAARDEPPDGRGPFLRSACDGDDEVRQEVESLLANADRSGSFLQTPALGDSFAVESPDRLSRRLPEQIGEYRILDLLGEGGMGVVYRAQQEHPRRTVALKVIKPGCQSREAQQRFMHEGEVLGWLQHPGIAQVFEIGTAQTEYGQQPFFAMELVSGAALGRYADEHGLSVPARLELVAKVCDAVEHAHQKGVIHRDLKPNNILVEESGQPKILDFGVARVTGAGLRLTTLQTSAGHLIGTMAYMSPEQVAGDPRALDVRSDVYALGVILYELLTGRVPVDVTQKTLPEAARAIAELEPPALSTFKRVFRGDLEAVVAKALEKEKARRYPSAAALADDLRRYLADQPVTARPVTTWYQFRKFARRNRFFVGAVSAVILALAAGTVGTSIGLVRAKRAEVAARREAGKAGAVSAFVTSMLASVEPGKQGRDARVLDVLDQAAIEVPVKFAEHPEVRAALHERLGASYHRLGALAPAVEQFRLAEAILRRDPGATRDLAGVLSSLGTTLHLQGVYAEAELALREAVRLRRAARPAQPGETSKTLSNLAGLQHTQGQYQEAGALWDEAYSLAQAHLPSDDPHTATIANNLASLALRHNDVSTAIRRYQEALSLYEQAVGREHPDTLTCRQNFAGVLAGQGQLDRAEAEYGEILELRRRLLGNDHPQVAVTLNNLAKVRLSRNDYSGAETLYREALDLFERTSGDEHPQVAIAHSNLAHTLLLLDRPAEAETHAARALEICAHVLPAGHQNTAVCRAEYGSALCKLQRWSEAATVLQQAFDELRTSFGESHRRTREVLALLGDVAEAQGNAEQAASWRARLSTSQPAATTAP
jgi:eukaryotic-like serine/threonine-protein kinase